MRPRNHLAYRLTLPLAIVVGPAFGAGAGPIVAPTVVPAGESPGPSKPKPDQVGKGARRSGRPGSGAALPTSPPRDRTAPVEDEDRPSSGLGDPSLSRATDEGNEVKEGTPSDPVPSSTHGLPSGGLLLLPLPPDPEPGESTTYAGEPSGTNGAAVGEVGRPIEAHTVVSPPRSPEAASTSRAPVTLSPPGTTTASAPVERLPGDRESIPAASATPADLPAASAPPADRGVGDPAPVLQAPLGAAAKASPSTAGPVVASPNAASSPLGSSAAGSTARDSGGASPASAETARSASGPAGTAPPIQSESGLAGTAPPPQDSGGAKPAGIATEAGASGRSSGVPSDSQTTVIANAPGPASGGSGGTILEASQGTGGMSSMDRATAFGQMLTTAVLTQELTGPGRTAGGGTQVEPSVEKSPLVMSDRALLAEVGGTTPLDANPGTSGEGGGANPPAPDLPLPAVEAGEGVRQVADPGVSSGTPLSPSISPRAIPEPTLLVQFGVVLAGSAFVIARRRLRR